jgi:hypothetical protein
VRETRRNRRAMVALIIAVVMSLVPGIWTGLRGNERQVQATEHPTAGITCGGECINHFCCEVQEPH